MDLRITIYHRIIFITLLHNFYRTISYIHVRIFINKEKVKEKKKKNKKKEKKTIEETSETNISSYMYIEFQSNP